MLGTQPPHGTRHNSIKRPHVCTQNLTPLDHPSWGYYYYCCSKRIRRFLFLLGWKVKILSTNNEIRSDASDHGSQIHLSYLVRRNGGIFVHDKKFDSNQTTLSHINKIVTRTLLYLLEQDMFYRIVPLYPCSLRRQDPKPGG